ncbi:MAG: hypothetical protein DWQ07_12805 [Chloroflexi bacterium]|nr:MAG: hypothetical protein DWQ07_12805 [Chloroflexota bacterium]MBL1196919.1 hypothetical protein [Chloroflexota bacterium]NOH14215.1 hypothetical protein [Chloroflexota bacterium]
MTIASIVISQNPVVVASPGEIERTLKQGHGWRENTYRHDLRAEGGFWTCSFSMLGDLDDLRDFSRKGLGAQVQSYTKEGDPAWEGYIHSMELVLPGFSSLSSFESMANRVWVRYTTSTAGEKTGSSAQNYSAEEMARQMLFGDGNTLRSTKYNDLASQARWSVKERVFSGGQMPGATEANNLAQQLLEKVSNPTRPNMQFKSGGGDDRVPYIDVKCRGWWHRFNWEVYTQTANTGNENVSAQQALIIAQFSDLVATSDVRTNTYQVLQRHNADRFASDILIDNTRLGDTSNQRYAVAMLEDRRFRYAPAAENLLTPGAVRYFTRALDPQRKIRDAGQVDVPFALVRPDNWIIAEDLQPYDTTQYATLDANPAAAYIEAVSYSEPNDIQIFSERGQMLDVLIAKAASGNLGGI